jgi:hypothetical protein
LTLAHLDPRNTRGIHSYDLRSVIAELSEPVRDPFAPPSGIAGEVHSDLRTRFSGDLPAGAVLLPMDSIWPRAEKRAAVTTSNAAGSIGTAFGGFVPALRARMVLGGLGVRILGLAADGFGGAKLARFSTGSAVDWIDSEGDDASQASPALDSVTFLPHDVGARVAVTRKMLHSTAAPGFEDVIAGDILSAIAVTVDRAGIVGTGDDGEPLGLLNTPSLPTVALGTTGAALTRSSLVSIAKTVGASNGDSTADARPGWLLNPATEAKLRLTETVEDTGRYLLTDDDKILGKPIGISTNMPGNLTKSTGTGLSAIAFGAWEQLALNIFGPPYILVDRHQSDGSVRLLVNVRCDWQPLQLAAFCAAVDVNTSLS